MKPLKHKYVGNIKNVITNFTEISNIPLYAATNTNTIYVMAHCSFSSLTRPIAYFFAIFSKISFVAFYKNSNILRFAGLRVIPEFVYFYFIAT
jgi:hypothetical protein